MFKKTLIVTSLLLPFSFSAFAGCSSDMDAHADKVNINTANAEALDVGLKHVGPELADRIVDFRKTNGEFKSIEELTQVNGLGERVIKSNQKVLSIE